MTRDELATFLNALVLICAVMAVVNVLRFRSRGASAYLLGSAFLLLGLMAFAYQRNASTPILAGGGILLFVLLIADVFYRMGRSK